MANGTYTFTGSVKTFTATNGGTYLIKAYGGQGGSAYNGIGGNGAEVEGDFTLTAGETLKIVVGGVGGPGYGHDGGGGGGGSFVVETNSSGAVIQKLLVAGGGGGGGFVFLAGNNGQAGYASPTGNGVAGTGGAGATGKGYGGGGGGGYKGGAGAGFGGQAGYAYGLPGYNATNRTSNPSSNGSYAGGLGYTSSGNSGNGKGGFGGGGGGGFSGGGGGGGGYGGGTGGSAYYNSGGGGGGYGGQGGGSFDSGTSQMLVSGENTGNGSVVITPLCFLRGTRVLTPTGEARVEDLQVGDPVVTRFGGIQPVKWLGRHSHSAGDPALTPVCIRAGALGERLPARDLYVSPGHSVLVDGTLLIARLLVNGVTVTQDWCPPRIDYFHIELPSHDCVIAEGAWAETYADAQVSRAAFDNAAEYEALYPGDGPAPDEFTLCAPRPERGAKLEAAMRPVVAQATKASAVAPGALAGSIDRIDGAWRVQGWAHDAAHAELPVLLEVELDGRVIGTVAACDERMDLAQAGFGRGRCAFTFTSPVRLRPELLGTLRVRRMADGMELTMHPSCAAQVPPAPKLLKPVELRLVAV